MDKNLSSSLIWQEVREIGLPNSNVSLNYAGQNLDLRLII